MKKTDLSQLNTNPALRAWKGTKNLFAHNQTWAIIFLVLTGTGSLSQFGSSDQAAAPANSGSIREITSGGLSHHIAILGLGVAIFFMIMLVIAYVNGVMSFVVWKTSRKENARLGEAFSAVSERLWTILAIQIIVILKIIGGMLLLIVPGIRAILRYQMVLLPVFDENLTAKQALARIKNLTKGHLLEVMGVVAMGIIPLAGGVLQMGGEATLYPQLKQLERYKGQQPKVHWLHYLLLLALIAAIVQTVATAHLL